MRSIIFCTLACWLLTVACRKEEFQQPPHGGPVPYNDTARYELKSLLGMTGHKLFYAAWQKSNLNTILAAQGAAMRYTILAPDDAAMTAAGYTNAAIAAAPVEELDSLLCFHVIPEYVDTLALRGQRGSVRRKTMLQDNTLVEYLNGVGSNVPFIKPYTYKQFLALGKDGGLLVNGRNTGKGQPMYATNGIIWPVNQLLKRPTESMLDIIRRDPRLSIFAELLQRTDEIWQTESMGYYERGNFKGLGLVNGTEVVSDGFFAPTNDAFKRAGFNSVDDLMALNSRSMPYFNWDTFEMVNGFVTDSLLAYHAWGRMYTPVGAFGTGNRSVAMFYSNDLDNNIIGDYDLTSSNGGNLPPYPMTLEFGVSTAGQITVKVKGSNHPAASITEADINTFQGPLHLVDNLILSNKVQY